MRPQLHRLAAPTVIATLGLAGVAIAQQAPTEPTPSQRPAGEAPARPSDERSTSFSAEVERLTRGRRGEVNGLLLDNGRLVKAPRHAIVRDLDDLPGRTVRVSGYEKPAKVGHATVVVDGETITAPREERRDVPAEETRVERSGEITGVTRGPRGEANGIVLADGTRVGVPREADAGSLVGRQATVTGWLKPAEVKDATVTADGVTYIRDEGPRAGGRRGGPRGNDRPASPSGGPRDDAPAPSGRPDEDGSPPAPPEGGPRRR